MVSAPLTSAIMDELVARMNCYGVGAWLAKLVADLGLAPPAAGTPATLPRSAGLVPKMETHLSSQPMSDARDAFNLSLAEGDDTVPAPLGLDRARPTIDTARAKLSSSIAIAGGSPAEIAAGDRRVSFFMDGGRVVELRFKPSLMGYDRTVVARLGSPRDWRNPASRL